MRRRAQHSPPHALSHWRADTCVVAIEVERAMAYVACRRRRAAELRLPENGVAMMLKRETEGVLTKVIRHFLAPTAQGLGLR